MTPANTVATAGREVVIIAIDGPAASGKGTLAERLARHFGYPHLESGRLYRAVAAKLLAAGQTRPEPALATKAAHDLVEADLVHPNLYGEETGLMASKVAAIPGVRDALLHFQRDFASHPPGDASGAVIDGRDIGTVICPQAKFKLFITARPEIRADRRLKQLRQRGAEAIHSRVLQDIIERDAMDTQRKKSPLRQAPDAYLLDTSELDADQAFAAALKLIEQNQA